MFRLKVIEHDGSTNACNLDRKTTILLATHKMVRMSMEKLTRYTTVQNIKYNKKL